jgi:hypothetical protein
VQSGSEFGEQAQTSTAQANQSQRDAVRLRRAARALKLVRSAWLVLVPLVLLGTVTAGAWFFGFVAILITTPLAMAAARAADRRHKTAEMHLAVSLGQAMTQDPRPAVLYLRSFSDEPETRRIHLGRHWDRAFAEEEFLIAELRKVGPFVAIGSPDDELPPAGAHRAYPNDSEWNAEVLRLMDRAGGVVIRLGPGGGLAWEIRQAVSRLSPEQLAILIPRDVAAYELFRTQIDPLLPVPLPPYPEISRRDQVPRAVSDLFGFLYSPPDWLRRLQPLARHLEAAEAASRDPFAPRGFRLMGCLHFAPDWSPGLEVFRFKHDQPSKKAVHREFSRCLLPFVSALSSQPLTIKSEPVPSAPPPDVHVPS